MGVVSHPSTGCGRVLWRRADFMSGLLGAALTLQFQISNLHTLRQQMVYSVQPRSPFDKITFYLRYISCICFYLFFIEHFQLPLEHTSSNPGKLNVIAQISLSGIP